ncbi:transglycosylase SLT domain-containing protein [Legionella waltersii]|uniref:Membrane bound lytic murein transglycosylase D n=1 Tax=Legionella waltersii TaxID=66969 RepID=A0A0W1A774_9GAMM|nr:membrane bound lytic murein transglycosylase D [Legionella waltersii]SNV11317.1 membrane bound lytic murein transglycosylase [Legionella waltersii]
MIKASRKIIVLLLGNLILLVLNPLARAYPIPDVWDVLRSEFKINHETFRPEVQEQIRWIQEHPGFVIKVCERSEPYIYHIVRELQKRKLPGELALLPMIESAYDPFAYSKVGAAGLWQIMPLTGSTLGLKQDWWFDGRRSINYSTEAAMAHLTHLNQVFNGNWVLSIAAYDAGEGAIGRAIKASSGRGANFWNLTVPRETQAYVPRFLALAEVMSNPKAYNITLPRQPFRPYFEVVNVGSQIDLSHAARLAGITYKELIQLNPGFNRWATTPYAPFHLLIPTAKAARFYFNLSHLPVDKRVSWIKHTVLAGDSLKSIATRYHTTTHLIKELNQLSQNYIRPNQVLLIPGAKNAPVLPLHEFSKAEFLQLTIIKPKEYRVIHIVQPNDNYQRIETLYGVSRDDIFLWNKLPKGMPLRNGQQLVIWKKAKSATA